MNAIEVKNLSRNFEKIKAVNDISFNVKNSEIFGFLGPNGAGKTTTINMLCTLTSPTSGNALVNGFDINKQENDVRKSIGLVFQDPSLDEKLKAIDNLVFHSLLYDVNKKDREQRINQLLKMVDLEDRKNDFVKFFSGGMKRRLEIARGLIHHPKILFLDEPTLGLDPQTRNHIWAYIKKLMKEKELTIFLTTHYMDEAEVCDRIAIIDNGKIVAIDTPDNLKKQVGGDIISMKSKNNKKLEEEISKKFSKFKVYKSENEVKAETPDAEKMVPSIVKNIDIELDYISVSRPTLDDVFLKMTGHEIRDETISGTDRIRAHGRMRRK